MGPELVMERRGLRKVHALDTEAGIPGNEGSSVGERCLARVTRAEILGDWFTLADVYPLGAILAFQIDTGEYRHAWYPKEPTHRVVSLVGKRVLEWRPHDWYRRPLRKVSRTFDLVEIQPVRHGRVVYGTEEEGPDSDITWLFVGVETGEGRDLWYKRLFVWATDELTAIQHPRRIARERAWQYALDLESIGFENAAVELKPVSPLSREDLDVWRTLGSILDRDRHRY